MSPQNNATPNQIGGETAEPLLHFFVPGLEDFAKSDSAKGW
jgi:hypothetical protein